MRTIRMLAKPVSDRAVLVREVNDIVNKHPSAQLTWLATPGQMSQDRDVLSEDTLYCVVDYYEQQEKSCQKAKPTSARSQKAR